MSDCIGNGVCNECTDGNCGNVENGTVNVSTADGGDGLADWANVLIALGALIVGILGLKCAWNCRRNCLATGTSGGTTGQESKAEA